MILLNFWGFFTFQHFTLQTKWCAHERPYGFIFRCGKGQRYSFYVKSPVLGNIINCLLIENMKSYSRYEVGFFSICGENYGHYYCVANNIDSSYVFG